ncbi:preprotein translocase subunit YajC, partial [uncultured Duncaniella sp.]
MLNTILLQSIDSSWANILMIVALIAVFYFMMIRPQQKRQNEIKKFREGLRVNDPVVTAGG